MATIFENTISIEQEKNYAGYRIVYGSKTVNEIKNAGFIPLTVKWTGKIDVNWGGGERDHHLVINGKRVMKEAVDAGYAFGYYDTNFDLDFYFKGNLTEMKNCTITSTDGDVGGAPGSKTIIKWLEPIA